MAKYKAYPEYKDSGVEWLGRIPEQWTVSKVKYLAPFQVGWTPPTKNDENFIGNNLWVTISDLRDKFISASAKFISNKAVKEASMNITPKGSLLYSFKLSVGAVSFAGCNLYTNEAIASFLENAHLPLSYLYYSLPIFIIENASTNIYGAKILNQELIKNSFLLAAECGESEKISVFLDHETAKIDNLLEKQQQLIELLKEKRQAVISHAVTKGLNPDVPMKDSGVEWLGQIPTHWSISKVRYCFLFDKGLTITKENLQDEGIPCINYGEIHSRYGFEINPNIHKLKYVNNAHLKNDKNSLLIKGDIIFADTSEDVEGAGNFSQLTTDSSIFAGYHTIIARPKERQNYRFLAYLFDCQELRSQIKHAVKGVKVFSITQAILRGLSIWLPPKNEQEYISKLLDNQTATIDTLIQKQLQQIELLKERRTALIAAAVTGKIDLRDWTPPASSTEAPLTAEEATA
ncbi:restriction endonuclease subunit S [Enterobacter asburiae]|uniref:restriction endonuclease subunit S n=1 Tax=Enterobacter asburiae TaxID=61645 RepID=UPI00079AB672|nr:restriction endonuclease subunit S [Enterobacter asburiae]ELP5721055.1 restriction endonuclease subunit S [Enterobacter asburiae]MCU3442830.1 restriction endonuclease subunit S [Enterobacter asburiae]SAH58614.1 restriction modification system DNA specificity domain-containing protein [Enterobacter asburiae]